MFNSYPKLLDVNRKPSQPKRRKKITLVFDEMKRREFLGGFRKRKLERKKKAQEQVQQQLKEERKRIKQETRERIKKLSYQNVPEVEELLAKQEYDLEGHIVSILELNVADLKEGARWIGQNKVAEEEEEQKDESEHSNDEDDEIIGMSLQKKQKDLVEQEPKSDDQKIKPSKNLKREIRKDALKKVKKTKAFQKQRRIDRQKGKKQQKRKLQQTEKLTHTRGKRLKKKSRH